MMSGTAGRYGYPTIDNTDPMQGPAQITAAAGFWDVFEDETVPAVPDMPPSSERPVGHHVWVETPPTDYVRTAAGWQDISELTPTPLTPGSGITLSAGISQSTGNTPVMAWRRQSVVFVHGCVNGTSASSYTLLSLPTGFRPSGVVQLWASSGGYVQVAASGDVSSPISGTKTNLSFQGFFHV